MSKQTAQKDQCICLNLRKASRVLTQIYDEGLRPTGYRSTQLMLMAVMDSEKCMKVNDLSERLLMDRTTLTRTLKPLEKDGLVSLCEGDDRREKWISLTAKGRLTIQKAYPLMKKVKDKVHATLGDQNVSRMVQDLQKTLDTIKT